MKQTTNHTQYDLEERTFQLAKNVRLFTGKLKRTIENVENIKQLTRSSGSIAANYIEANESLSKKDFLMRIKISKKEAKESRLWLRLINTFNDDKLDNERDKLIEETVQLMKIFGSIVEKSK